MKGKTTNLPALISGYLRNLAREKNASLEFMLRRYALERLLPCACLSPHRNRFILKGAMPFIAWFGDPFRPTRDLDLLGFRDASAQSHSKTFREVCQRPVDDDGLKFDADGLVVESIRNDRARGGARVRTGVYSAASCMTLSARVG
jgi:hypothetical protein